MNQTMSFAQTVKEEIASNDYESEQRIRALLAAFIRINGHVSFRHKTTSIHLRTENAKVARFIYTTINSFYNKSSHIEYIQKNNLNKRIQYEIVIDDADQIINDLEIDFLEGKIAKNIIKNDDSIAGYLAGAFLASGSINSPTTSNYHMEIVVNSENYARWMLHLFSRYKNTNIEPKIIERRGKYVIYFKKSDQIADFLIMIGAVSSCMEFENIRVDRDFTNSANRLANFDVANMKRTVSAGQKQIEQIKAIDKVIGIDNITNKKARILCHLRLEYESASLLELARMMSEELNTPVSKSNINHLFRYLNNLYSRVGK